MTGQAILTSSSEDESSQESDRLGALFTHHLISGPGRGGHDAGWTGDAQRGLPVRLPRDASRTERTQRGAQHPPTTSSWRAREIW
ncbi:hypothetical protein ACN28S_21710 [Cystobacter fuscus]